MPFQNERITQSLFKIDFDKPLKKKDIYDKKFSNLY